MASETVLTRGQWIERARPHVRSLLLFVCLVVLAVILTLGLWPFHAPRNDVAWLKGENGLRFGPYGTVIGGTLQHAQSIEIWMRAVTPDESGTVLSLYRPGQRESLTFGQSLSDLEVRYGRGRQQHFYVGDVFRTGKPVFAAIVFGTTRTAVYINGTLARTAAALPSETCSGRLIVGDSPRQQDSWSGEVRGLAVYSSELTAQSVWRHYQTWSTAGQPDLGADNRIAVLYLFDERSGAIIHNRARTSGDLVIPETYTVVDKIRLEPFWDEFDLSWSFCKNVARNIVGFIPLGICFCAYLAIGVRTRRAGLITVILGGLVSLTIEVLQGYLPTRDSGTMDLITNTFGTWVGVLLFLAAQRHGTRFCSPVEPGQVERF